MSSNTSTGQWVGYIVGAVAGFFTGGATWYAMLGAAAYGAAVGGAIGGMIDPPMGPSMQGPRLNDLGQQGASYGTFIPRVYGSAALAGNIFWIENNALKEVSTTETQGGKGGGGSEVTTYSYCATFALGLCKGPVDGVRRIWCSGRLIYDAGAIDIETAEATQQLSASIRLYKGDETQLPDPRMQATVGVDKTPAYRGLAYLVFEDFPLAEYGNTLLGAQFKVEVVNSATYTSEILDEWSAPVDGVSVYYNAAAVSVTGRSSSTRFVAAQYPGFNYLRLLTLNDDGSLRDQKVVLDVNYSSWGAYINYDISLDTIEFATNLDTYAPIRNALVFGPAEGPLSALYVTRPGDVFLSASEVGGFGVALTRGYAPGALDDRSLYTRVYSFSGEFIDVPYSILDSGIVRSAGAEMEFVVLSGENIYKYSSFSGWSSSFVSRPSGAPIRISDGYIKNGILVRIFRESNGDVATNKSWYDRSDYASLTLIDDGYGLVDATSSLLVWKTYVDNHIMSIAGNVYPDMKYAPDNVFVSRSSVNSILPGSEALGDIISSECTLVGLESSDIDVSTLTDEVRGYRVGRVAAVRANIDPLQGAFPFDIVQSGYQIRFARRGLTGSVATIPADDLAASDDSKPSPRLTQSREMDSQLPAMVTIDYIDIDREYDANSQEAARITSNSVNTRAIEMPIVMSASEAAQKAEVLLYMYWSERTSYAFSLPPSYAALEPGDIITVPADDAALEVRLVDVNQQSNGVIACQAKPVASYISTAVADSGSTVSAPALVAGTTALDLLDIPAIADINAGPGYILSLGRYRSGWPGGAAYKSKDDGETWSLVDSTRTPSGIGFASNIIAAPASFALIDTASQLAVTMHLTSLSSVGELQMLNGQNHFAYGAEGRWEIVAARNCVLQGDGTYILSDLLRGRFGSEANAGLHVKGDRVVLLDKNTLRFVPGSLNDIGVEAIYRAVTTGAVDTNTVRRNFTYRAVNLRPLAPVYLNGNRHPSTLDWTLNWVRRTRLGGEWRDGVDVPLGETSEAYEIDVYATWTYATVVRTISVSGGAAATYTSAQQITDFTYNPTTLYVRIYQISADAGRGYPLTTAIVR